MDDNNKILEVLALNKEGAYNFRERRHSDWTENYTLYRDKVLVNRLEQRQSVNVPLMKSSIKTLLKDVDDPPMLYFKNRNNDTQKEVYYNEHWKVCGLRNKLIIKDNIDKKQVFLFGRSFKNLNIVERKFYFGITDPQDMLVERYIDPANLDTARYICHEHIFKPLSSLSLNPMYDKVAIERLKDYYATRAGLIENAENTRSLEEKNKRLELLGQIDVQTPTLGETMVELNHHFLKIFDKKLNRDVIWFYVTSGGREILAKKPLHELIGKTVDDYWMEHYPFTSWGDDPERTDFWSDAIADTLRTPNKILNSWISQLVENRTLKNFNMNYYNSILPDGASFVPQTFDPVAWGWYPYPGNPNAEIKQVQVQDLSESLDEVQFILNMAEKAVAATSTQQGSIQETKVTLGEIQLALANAKERVKSIAILYTDSWLEFGHKYIKLLEAAGDMLEPTDISREGKSTSHIYSQTIGSKDWEDKAGYGVEVIDLSASATQKADSLQKLTYAKSLMPNNQPLNEIVKQKSLEFAELNANEIKDVMEAEKNQVPMFNQPIQGQMANPGAPTIQPPPTMTA